MKELKIDPELRDLLPPLTDDEYKQLEKNIVENGFDKNFPIMEWNGMDTLLMVIIVTLYVRSIILNT